MVLPISPLPPELAAALAPDETAAAFMRRCGGGPVPTGLPFAPSLRPGDAMELVGASGSGRTRAATPPPSSASAGLIRAAGAGGSGAPLLSPPATGRATLDAEGGDGVV